MVDYLQHYLGGQWVTPALGGTFEIRSPHDNSLVGRAAQATAADVDRAVAIARATFDAGTWPQTTPAERAAIVRRFNDLHRARAAEIAALVTSENGSPAWFTQSIQAGCHAQTEAYLRAAEAFDWESRQGEAVVRREPVGVVAAVIPWNAPHQSALVKVIPALLAGCTVILKVAPETALDGLLLGEIFTAAGLPDGVLSILAADREASEHLVSHPDVDKIAFTGSTSAGRRIASIAGSQLKRVSLELGGKSAAIVLEDADLALVAQAAIQGSFVNNGESCVAQTRLLVPRSRYDEVVTAVTQAASAVAVGDPSAPGTFVGPLVTARQKDRVQDYIRSGIEEGARVVVGGLGTPDGISEGNYVRPTVFADVKNSMRIAQEEIFGPVLAIIPFDDEEDAVRIANDSPYGLGGSVWTADAERGLSIARRVRTGTFMVNGSMPSFDVPFGGFKASGIGREFGAPGLSQYVEYKSIGM